MAVAVIGGSVAVGPQAVRSVLFASTLIVLGLRRGLPIALVIGSAAYPGGSALGAASSWPRGWVAGTNAIRVTWRGLIAVVVVWLAAALMEIDASRAELTHNAVELERQRLDRDLGRRIIERRWRHG